MLSMGPDPTGQPLSLFSHLARVNARDGGSGSSSSLARRGREQGGALLVVEAAGDPGHGGTRRGHGRLRIAAPHSHIPAMDAGALGRAAMNAGAARSPVARSEERRVGKECRL